MRTLIPSIIWDDLYKMTSMKKKEIYNFYYEMNRRCKIVILKLIPDIDDTTGMMTGSAIIQAATNMAEVDLDTGIEKWKLEKIRNSLDEILMSITSMNLRKMVAKCKKECGLK